MRSWGWRCGILGLESEGKAGAMVGGEGVVCGFRFRFGARLRARLFFREGVWGRGDRYLRFVPRWNSDLESGRPFF